MKRGTSAHRERIRRQIRWNEPPCGICKHPIDYSLPHLDPKSFVVDHVIPLNRGGTDDITNAQAAHRDCNRAKSDLLPAEMAAARPEIEPLSVSRAW